MRKTRSIAPLPGAGSLLTMFSVLCLTVFALLSISTVRTQQTLSDAAFAAVEGYSAADAAAEEVLARLRSGEIPDGVREQDGVYRYACPISDTAELEVEVKVSGAEYTVLRWQAVRSSAWEHENRWEVWDGVAVPEAKGV